MSRRESQCTCFWLVREGREAVCNRCYREMKEGREEARQIARAFCRAAQHLAVMHRRENRVMEGGEGEIERLRRKAAAWIADPAEEEGGK